MMLLNRAIEELEKEKQDREEEKNRYLEEKHPSLQISGLSLAELQVMHSVRKSILVEDKMCSLASFIIFQLSDQLYLCCIFIFRICVSNSMPKLM